MQENKFCYWRFIVGRVARLWPLVLIMTAVALGMGLFTVLPDDLENLSESVIASNVFANNVLSCITPRNYWHIANVFKTLMHTWYVGVLMQAYVLLPLVYLGLFKLTKGNMKMRRKKSWEKLGNRQKQLELKRVLSLVHLLKVQR